MFKNLIKKSKAQKGFTIIEVMIVLAIAGLILVVVLIAVPQLQRNQRNSARTADASRVATTVGNWAANNKGAIFVAGTGNANIQTIIDDMGGLSQYDGTQVATFTIKTGVQSTPNTDLTKVYIVTGAKCDVSGKTAQGSPKQFAIQYATENSTGTAVGQCIES